MWEAQKRWALPSGQCASVQISYCHGYNRLDTICDFKVLQHQPYSPDLVPKHEQISSRNPFHLNRWSHSSGNSHSSTTWPLQQHIYLLVSSSVIQCMFMSLVLYVTPTIFQLYKFNTLKDLPSFIKFLLWRPCGAYRYYFPFKVWLQMLLTFWIGCDEPELEIPER